jgi:uncharacterized membrane protein YphA (DoxX/SURF4 family)
MRDALIYRIARAVVAFIWIYHGLVTKIIVRDPDELALLAASGVSAAHRVPVLLVVGALELLFGLLVLGLWRARWPLLLSALAMVGATLGVAVTAPHYLTTAFNAVTFNCAVAALSLIAFLSGPQTFVVTR